MPEAQESAAYANKKTKQKIFLPAVNRSIITTAQPPAGIFVSGEPIA